MSDDDYAGLIAAAHRQLHAPIILVWDNLNTPTEGAWAHVKRNLGNLVACTVIS
jgi:hypothetical protein